MAWNPTGFQAILQCPRGTLLVPELHAAEADAAGDDEAGGAAPEPDAPVVRDAAEAAAGSDLDGEVLRDDDGDAGETDLELDDGVLGDDGAVQVQRDPAEGRLDVGPFEDLAGEGDVLFAEGGFDPEFEKQMKDIKNAMKAIKDLEEKIDDIKADN